MKNRIKNKNYIFTSLLVLIFLVSSCFTPTTKDDYIEQFSAFVDNVRQDHRNYNKSDWEYADRRFKKFSTEWHERFKNELSLKEELKVGSLIVQYNSYKGFDKLEEIYNKDVKEDVDKLKEKIQYYIDNDMDEDLEKLKEGAKEIGDSARRVVDDIIKKIKD